MPYESALASDGVTWTQYPARLQAARDAAHAFSLLDCYVYGQVIQEISLPFATSQETNQTARSTVEQTTMNDYPHLAAMYEHALTHRYSFDDEFEFGLDLILDGLERHRATPPS